MTTWNNADQVAGTWTLSGADLIATRTSTDGGSYRSIRATDSHASGKWYFEVAASATAMIGLGQAGASLSTYNGAGADSWGMLVAYSAPARFHNGGNSAISGASTASDLVYGIAIDLDTGTLTLYESNVSLGGIFSTALGSAVSGTVFPMISSAGTPVVTAAFADADFTYTPPSGYSAWDAGGGGSSTTPQIQHYRAQL